MNSTDPRAESAGSSQAVATMREQGLVGWLYRLVRVREAFIVAILLVIIVIMSIVEPSFRSPANIRAVLLGFSMEGIVVVGMAILLVSGGFDLSVGATMALAGMVAAYFMGKGGIPVPLAVLIGLGVAALIGVFNAWLVAKVGVNALIATLGTMTIVRGVSLYLWEGRPVSQVPESFRAIGQGKLLGIPIPAIILLVLVVIFDILMRRGSWFRQLYFVGSSERAARLSGINVTQVRFITYVLAGVLAGAAGILSTARLSAAYPNAYDGSALRVISGAVIGGCSLFGGEGSVVGAVLGLFFIALMLDVGVLTGVSVYIQGIVQGVALILAVVVDIWSKRQMARH